MHFDRYSRLEIDGSTIDALAARVAAWMIPAEARARSGRAAVGMPGTWVAEQLAEDVDLTGHAELRVHARWSKARDEFIARLVHRDSTDSAVFWHTVFRVRRSGPTRCSIEAGTGRTAPPRTEFAPKAYSPRVISDLLRDPGGVRVVERALTLPKLVAKTAHDARALVDELLLRDGRTTPVTVVAADLPPPGTAHIDADAIARKVHGVSVLCVLDGVVAASAYRDALEARGYERELACFNGGIHTYGPTDAISDDHRLWLGRSLSAMPAEDRSERVGEALTRQLTLKQLPPGFFSLIEEHDRRTRSERVTQSVPPSSKTGLAEELRAALALMEESNRARQEVQAELDALRIEKEQVEQERQQLEIDLQLEISQREHLQQQLDEHKKRDRGEGLTPDIAEPLREHFAGRAPAPAEALRLIESLFPDRIEVLADAYESAEEASVFKNRKDAFGLLCRLATGYWEAMVREPGKAHTVFTVKEYAADGSESEHNDRRCVEDRVRMRGGKKVEFWKHLKAGGNGGPDKCFRIHFEWIAEERKIVIGHCGRHLRESAGRK